VHVLDSAAYDSANFIAITNFSRIKLAGGVIVVQPAKRSTDRSKFAILFETLSFHDQSLDIARGRDDVVILH
jgi:hypothetical protein